MVLARVEALARGRQPLVVGVRHPAGGGPILEQRGHRAGHHVPAQLVAPAHAPALAHLPESGVHPPGLLGAGPVDQLAVEALLAERLLLARVRACADLAHLEVAPVHGGVAGHVFGHRRHGGTGARDIPVAHAEVGRHRLGGERGVPLLDRGDEALARRLHGLDGRHEFEPRAHGLGDGAAPRHPRDRDQHCPHGHLPAPASRCPYCCSNHSRHPPVRVRSHHATLARYHATVSANPWSNATRGRHPRSRAALALSRA